MRRCSYSVIQLVMCFKRILLFVWYVKKKTSFVMLWAQFMVFWVPFQFHVLRMCVKWCTLPVSSDYFLSSGTGLVSNKGFQNWMVQYEEKRAIIGIKHKNVAVKKQVVTMQRCRGASPSTDSLQNKQLYMWIKTDIQQISTNPNHLIIYTLLQYTLDKILTWQKGAGSHSMCLKAARDTNFWL